jgi:hypothetical protein
VSKEDFEQLLFVVQALCDVSLSSRPELYTSINEVLRDLRSRYSEWAIDLVTLPDMPSK